MPLWRKEISYSGTFALTKVFAKHEMRSGFDFVRLELNHNQAEWGDYGLKGGFSFGGYVAASAAASLPLRKSSFCCAVPVAAAETLGKLKRYADEVVCLETPLGFHAVGQFYRDFGQVEDEEVISLLAGIRA